MTALVLIRHGPTDWTAERRIQGRTDRPLSPEGRAAVRRWRLPGDIPDGQGGTIPPMNAAWLTSPLARARETAALLAAPWGIAPRVDDRLTEIAYGDWEGRLLPDVNATLGRGPETEKRLGLDYAPPSGESPQQVQRRLAPLVRECALSDHATIAVCHKGVIRALYALAVGWDMRVKPPHRLRDATAHVLALSPDGIPSLVAVNIALERDAGT